MVKLEPGGATRRPISALDERYLVGADVADISDYTAISVVKITPNVNDKGAVIGPPFFDVSYLDRFNGRGYPAVVDAILDVANMGQIAGKSTIILDATGVGKPVYDFLRLESHKRNLKIPIEAVWFTAGERFHRRPDGMINLPKLDMAQRLQLAFQQRRVRIAADMEFTDTLAAELASFTLKFTKTARVTAEAWRDKDHDDLVFSVGLPVWYAETFRPGAVTGGIRRLTIPDRASPRL